MEPVEPVLKNIYQSNTYRKDLGWSHFNNKPRVQKKQHVKEQQYCIFVFVAFQQFQEATRGAGPNVTTIPYMGIWWIYRDTEQPQERETS